MQTIPLWSHPSNLDPTARLVSEGINRYGIYRVVGGYLACVARGQCLARLFESEADAREAQREWASKGDA